jgi:hypothetical protein
MLTDLPGSSRIFLLMRFSPLRLLSIFSIATVRRCLNLDVETYINENPDVPLSPRNAYIHFIRHGQYENRQFQTTRNLKFSSNNQINSFEQENSLKNMTKLIYPDFGLLQEKLRLEVNQSLERAPSQDLLSAIGSAKLKNIKLLSLDIWGTLLMRKCHPDSSKLAGVVKLVTLLTGDGGNGVDLSFSERRNIELLRRRFSIEGDLALGANRDRQIPSEYEIRTVLKCLGHEISSTASSERVNVCVEDAVKAELMFEIKHSYLNPEILNLIKMAKNERVPVVFVSDTYLSTADLRILITSLKKQISVTEDLLEIPIYASCEIGTSKAWGNLLAYVREDMKVQPQHHLHLGDSLTADIYPQTRDGGLAHYLPDLFMQSKDFGEYTEATLANQIRGELDFSSLVLRTCSERSAHTTEGYELIADGRKLGFAVGAWLYWLTNQLRINSTRKVFFLSREGYRLAELFSLVTESQYKDGIVHHDSIRGVHLEVSRLSTFCASLKAGSVEELMRMWRQYSSQTPAALFRSLGMEAGLVSEALLKKHGLREDVEINEPWRDSALLGLLNSSGFRKVIAEHVTMSKTKLRDYLHTREWPEDWAELVDVGWRGSIQDNLTRATGTHTKGSYLGLFPHLNPPDGTQKNGFAFDKFDFDFHDYVGNKVSVIERFLTPLIQSPRAYAVGGFVLYSEPDVVEDHARSNFQTFSSGVDLGCLAMYQNLQLNSADGFVARVAAREAISDFIDNPSSASVKLFLNLPHDESFGVGTSQSELSLETVWPAAHKLRN